jgi:ribulose 1,5-bisphosphate synthetase/thiazole synthase
MYRRLLIRVFSATLMCSLLLPFVVEAKPETLTVSEADRPDLIIVGAGIAGLSAALEAGRGGAKVLVIDEASIFGGEQDVGGY